MPLKESTTLGGSLEISLKTDLVGAELASVVLGRAADI